MKQFIKCPECGAVELANVDTTTYPWNTFIHSCSKCKYCIMESEWDQLKALSIQHPWAWAIVAGLKDIENRSWPTKFTGTILIHAGKKFDNEGYEFLEQAFKQAGKLNQLPSKSDFKNWMGGICGSVEITGCVNESKSPWFFGPYGFTLKNARMMDIVKCNGQLSFFTPKID